MEDTWWWLSPMHMSSTGALWWIGLGRSLATVKSWGCAFAGVAGQWLHDKLQICHLGRWNLAGVIKQNGNTCIVPLVDPHGASLGNIEFSSVSHSDPSPHHGEFMRNHTGFLITNIHWDDDKHGSHFSPGWIRIHHWSSQGTTGHLSTLDVADTSLFRPVCVDLFAIVGCKIAWLSGLQPADGYLLLVWNGDACALRELLM